MSERFPTFPVGPHYGPRTEWENQVVLAVLQSSLGLIGPQVRGLAVEIGPDHIIIHACLGERTQRAIDDLDDLVGDLEADLAGTTPMPSITVQTEVGETDETWSGWGHRRLYGRYIFADEDQE